MIRYDSSLPIFHINGSYSAVPKQIEILIDLPLASPILNAYNEYRSDVLFVTEIVFECEELVQSSTDNHSYLNT